MIPLVITKVSATGTRTRVFRVRAEHPNQLDYGGDNILVSFARGSIVAEMPSRPNRDERAASQMYGQQKGAPGFEPGTC